jgi:hypothetical protein
MMSKAVTHHWLGRVGTQIFLVPGSRMISMTMRDKGITDRMPWIYVHIRSRAVKAVVGKLEKFFHENLNRKLGRLFDSLFLRVSSFSF